MRSPAMIMMHHKNGQIQTNPYHTTYKCTENRLTATHIHKLFMSIKAGCLLKLGVKVRLDASSLSLGNTEAQQSQGDEGGTMDFSAGSAGHWGFTRHVRVSCCPPTGQCHSKGTSTCVSSPWDHCGVLCCPASSWAPSSP